MIIHHIQPITGHATGSPRPRFSSFHFLRESAHLKAELNRAYEHLVGTFAFQSISIQSKCPQLQCSKQSAIAAAFIVPNDGALEVATLTTQAVGIVCEFPILNVLKPVALMAALICDRARVNIQTLCDSRAVAKTNISNRLPRVITKRRSYWLFTHSM